MENWIGWNPAVMVAMKEMEDSQEDRVEIQQCLDKMDETLMNKVKKLRAMEVSQTLRDEKENKLLSAFKEWKIKSKSDS